MLALPADAREVKVTGDDLAGTKVTRGADRAQALQIEWKTRGMLESVPKKRFLGATILECSNKHIK